MSIYSGEKYRFCVNNYKLYSEGFALAIGSHDHYIHRERHFVTLFLFSGPQGPQHGYFRSKTHCGICKEVKRKKKRINKRLFQIISLNPVFIV